MYKITTESQLFIFPKFESELKLRAALKSHLETKEFAVKRASNDLVSLDVFKKSSTVLNSFGKIERYNTRTKRFYSSTSIVNLADFEFELIEQDLFFRLVKSYCNQYSEHNLYLCLLLIYNSLTSKEGYCYGIFIEEVDYNEILPSLKKICHQMTVNNLDQEIDGTLLKEDNILDIKDGACFFKQKNLPLVMDYFSLISNPNHRVHFIATARKNSNKKIIYTCNSLRRSQNKSDQPKQLSAKKINEEVSSKKCPCKIILRDNVKSLNVFIKYN